MKRRPVLIKINLSIYPIIYLSPIVTIDHLSSITYLSIFFSFICHLSPITYYLLPIIYHLPTIHLSIVPLPYRSRFTPPHSSFGPRVCTRHCPPLAPHLPPLPVRVPPESRSAGRRQALSRKRPPGGSRRPAVRLWLARLVVVGSGFPARPCSRLPRRGACRGCC